MNQQKEDLKNIVIVEKPEFFYEDKDNKVRLISTDDEDYLEGTYTEMIEFMRTNHNQAASDKEKDELYGKLQEMWNEVSGKNGGKLNEVSFSLVLYRKEYNYLLSLIRDKFEYDADTIFYGLELQNLLKNMSDNSKFNGDHDAKGFIMTPVDVHYLYNLISKITVKGLGEKSIYFANIIQRIAMTSRVFNYYKEKYTNLAKAIQFWVASLDKGVTIPETDNAYKLIWGGSDIKPTFVEIKEEVLEGNVLEGSEVTEK